MRKLAIVVEGQTEAYFAKYVLKRYLFNYNIILSPPVVLGGNVNIGRLTSALSMICDTQDCDFLTSLVDFYGFQGRLPQESCDRLITRISDTLEEKYRERVIAYVQQYEFESLIFTDTSLLCSKLSRKGTPDNCFTKIEQEVSGKAPEDINDDISSAPSKRIKKIFKSYNKVIYGYLIAQEIGIERIRKSCPRFNTWLKNIVEYK